MEFQLSFDDASKEDIKLAEIIAKYNFHQYTTFYINTFGKLSVSDIDWLYKMGFLIGGHTETHPQDMKLLSAKKQYHEIKTNKELLEGIIGDEITSFAYPRGRYNDETIKQLKKAGFKEARTTIVLKTEYTDKFKKPTTIHIRERVEYNGRDWLDIAKELFLKAKKDNSYFHAWGHGWEIQKFNQWDKLLEFLKFIKAKL
jgi:peptidoglycan/xylan/chitin deacetylase (PgdA/CDA1 family)